MPKLKSKSPGRKIFPRFFLPLLLLGAALAGPQEVSAREKTVSSVRVEGLRRLSQSAVISRIRIREGEPYRREEINADLQRLHEWGPFSSIRIDAEEDEAGLVEVVITVEEKPRVRRIFFEGNRHFRDKKLSEEIATATGDLLSKTRLHQDIRALEELYEKARYYQTEIDYRIRTDPEAGEADVFINIREGHQVRVRQVDIRGLDELTAKELRKVMRTRPRSPFAIIRRGRFEEDEFGLDLERIALYARSRGYLDFQVLESDLEVTEDGAGLLIEIRVAEGERYYVGVARVAGNDNFPAAELERLLRLRASDAFSPEAMRTDAATLRDFYFQRGYIDALIDPRQVLNPETGKIEITYRIRENRISYINRVEISGNLITRDRVIRRELRVKPGEIFDGIKVRRARSRLQNLGFFQQVSIDPVPTAVPEKKDLAVRVEEKKTGEFMFGIGYSSEDDFIGFVEIAQGNFDLFNPPFFMGAGQKMRVRAELGTRRSNYELSFTEPWLFGIPLSFGVDLYRRNRFWSDYSEKRTGGALRLRKMITDFTQLGLTYRLEDIDIYDISSFADQSIQDEKGSNWVSSITPSITRDTRDSFLIPTRGARATLSCQVAGGILGGDRDFIKATFDGSYFISIFPQHVLGFRFRAGTVHAYGDTDVVPVYERFFLGGGSTIRGFRFREVGPEGIDPETGEPNREPVGGDSMMMATAEYTFPIINMLRGALFYDVGNVWADGDWENDEPIFTDGWFKSLNSGAGIGIRFYSPIGPIQLDYAWPLVYEDWNKTSGRFHFNLGYAF